VTSLRSSNERRKYPRLTRSVPVKIHQDSYDFVTETTNISRSGAYCKVNKYIMPMTNLDICLFLPPNNKEKSPAKKIFCRGAVVRTESLPEDNSYNIAVFFSDISSKDVEAISEFIKLHLDAEK
jgi:hypothetical protein